MIGERYKTHSQEGGGKGVTNRSLDANTLLQLNAGDGRNRKLPDDVLSQTTNYYKGYKKLNKQRMRPLPKNMTNENNLYGAGTLTSENMKDIMENNF